MNYHVCSFHKCASNWTRRLFRHEADLLGFNERVWFEHSFRAVTERAPGEEDRSDHHRGGTAGDWVHCSAADLARSLDAAFGDTCDLLGYERASQAIAITRV